MASSPRSPALIGAFVLLVLVASAIGLLLVPLFKRERRGTFDPGDVATEPAARPKTDDEPRAAAQPPVERSEARRPPPPDAGGDVPVWARTPGIWTTPYPEGGKINPPLPPVILPPEMVGSSDAGPPANPPPPDGGGEGGPSPSPSPPAAEGTGPSP